MDLKKFFEDHENEFLEFKRVENKLSNRPDLHAFLLLEKLVPGKDDIVGSAAHDEIYLSTDVEKLLKVASEQDLIDLRRCGVLYNNDYDSLYMFV
jgi:hypothetical protein